MNKSMTSSKKPSLADVARLAHVAPSTVSLVLNGGSRVAEGTRDTVLKAVRKLKYERLRGGRPRGPQLKAGKTRQITLVFSLPNRLVLKSPVYSEVLHGVESALAARRYSLVVRYRCEQEAVEGPLLLTKADGVLLFGHLDADLFQRELPGLPLVHFMGIAQNEGLYDHVSYNNARIGKLAAEYLLRRGHRRVAFVGHDEAKTTLQRGAAFLREMEAEGGSVLKLTDRQPLVISTAQRHAVDSAVMRRLVEQLCTSKPRPTAVFLAMDMLLPPFVSVLRERGPKAEKALELIGCNNDRPYLAALHPRPATIDIHAEAVGRKAVEQLFWRMDHPQEPRVSVLLEPELLASGSE